MLRDDLALDGVPQLVIRLGIGTDVPPPPRRSVEEVTFAAHANLA
jgi:hypothetical protein